MVELVGPRTDGARHSLWPLRQLRQLGDNRRNAPGFVLRH